MIRVCLFVHALSCPPFIRRYHDGKLSILVAYPTSKGRIVIPRGFTNLRRNQNYLAMFAPMITRVSISDPGKARILTPHSLVGKHQSARNATSFRNRFPLPRGENPWKFQSARVRLRRSLSPLGRGMIIKSRRN